MRMLTADQKRVLIRVARQSLRHAVAGDAPPDLTTQDPALQEKRGAFVTLKIDGDLRGCIGHVVAVMPLIESVANNASAAALEDPRFPPVRPRELERIRVEISALTPMRPVADISAIEVGRHGLMITRGPCRGLLLPQVPVEWGWSREEFLAHTCAKAGLPANAWRQGARIECFEAEVFGEDDVGQ